MTDKLGCITCKPVPGPGGPDGRVEERNDWAEALPPLDLQAADEDLDDGTGDEDPSHSHVQECWGRVLGVDGREGSDPIGEVEEGVWELAASPLGELLLRQGASAAAEAAKRRLQLGSGNGLRADADERLLRDGVDEAGERAVQRHRREERARHAEEVVVAVKRDLGDGGDSEQEEEEVV